MRRSTRHLVFLGVVVCLVMGLVAPSSALMTKWDTIAVAKTWGGVNVESGPDDGAVSSVTPSNGYPLQESAVAVTELTSSMVDDPRRIRLVVDLLHNDVLDIRVNGTVAVSCTTLRTGFREVFVEFLEDEPLPYRVMAYNRMERGRCDRAVVTVRVEGPVATHMYEMRTRIQVRHQAE